MSLRRLAALGALLILLGPGARLVCAADGFLSGSERQQLKSIAEGLARHGRREAFERVAESMRRLGVDPTFLEKLENRGASILTRARKVGDGHTERNKLAKLVETLGTRLADLEGPARQETARALLALDGRLEAAHQALDHVQFEGRWVPTWLKPCLQKRREIEAIVDRVRRMPFDIQVGKSNEPSFVEAYGDKAVMAKWGPIEVHLARRGPAGARRTLLQALRAWHLASETAGLPTEPDPDLAVKVGFHWRTAEYRKSIPGLVAAGRLTPAEAKQGLQLGSLRTHDGYLIVERGLECYAQASVMIETWWGNTARHLHGRDLPCLEAGHVNWASLLMIGAPMPRVSWVESEWETKLGSTLDAETEKLRRKKLMLAHTGIAGTHGYMRFLAARRLDPPWRQSFVNQVGKIQGHDLLKCTVVDEFLLESGRLPDLLASTVGKREGDADAQQKALEAVLGQGVLEFEKQWRAWLAGESGFIGVVQLLEHGPASADVASAPAWLKYLNHLRRTALAKASDLVHDEDLAKGALAHAVYLGKHPEQTAAWPDAHEEHTDEEGYSPAGARAGSNSVIAPGVKSMREAIDDWMGTYYHRLPLLHPGLLAVGGALDDDIAVLDCGSMVDERTAIAYVMWPPPATKGVPTAFVPELPTPTPGVKQSTLGYPITFQILPDGGNADVKLTLYKGNRKAGAEVACYVTTPGEPLNPELAPTGCYGLIPQAHLDAKSKYTVVVTGIHAAEDDAKTEERVWWFQTR